MWWLVAGGVGYCFHVMRSPPVDENNKNKNYDNNHHHHQHLKNDNNRSNKINSIINYKNNMIIIFLSHETTPHQTTLRHTTHPLIRYASLQ